MTLSSWATIPAPERGGLTSSSWANEILFDNEGRITNVEVLSFKQKKTNFVKDKYLNALNLGEDDELIYMAIQTYEDVERYETLKPCSYEFFELVENDWNHSLHTTMVSAIDYIKEWLGPYAEIIPKIV